MNSTWQCLCTASGGGGSILLRARRVPLATGRVRAVASLGLCEAGRLELALLFGVCFSMNTAISGSNSISRASNWARLSPGLILPVPHSDSKRAYNASNSVRSNALFTVSIAGYPTAEFPVPFRATIRD